MKKLREVLSKTVVPLYFLDTCATWDVISGSNPL